MPSLHYIANNAQSSIETVQFNREIANERLMALPLLIIEFFLAYVPFYNAGDTNKHYLIFSLVFTQIFSGLGAYEITFKHIDTYQTMIRGIKLMNVVYPTPKQIVALSYTQYLRYISLLTVFCFINCFMFYFFLGFGLAIFLPQVLLVAFGALLGFVMHYLFDKLSK